jgi:hypothetical protein
MTSDIAIALSTADRVIAALKVLEQAGPDGLDAARRKNPDFVEFLHGKVRAILDAPSHQLAKIGIPDSSELAPPSTGHSSNAPSDLASNTRPEPHSERQLIFGSGTKRQSTTRKLADSHGSRPVTLMIRFVIFQHLENHIRDTSVKTILEELVRAKLMDNEQRPSLVTNLNRLKNKDKFITWPDGGRGEQIVLTSPGKSYLGELISKKLQEKEIAYLKENASPSLWTHLEQHA